MIIGTNSNPIVSGKYKKSFMGQTSLYNRWWKPQQVLQKPYDDDNDGGI